MGHNLGFLSMSYDPQQLETDINFLTSQPDWQDEAKRGDFIRDVAVQLRSDPTVDHETRRTLVDELWGRKDSRGRLERAADWTGNALGEVVKSVPAAPAAAVIAVEDTLGITDSGSGTRVARGVANLWDQAGQRLKQMMPGESNQSMRDGTLDALKKDLDDGVHPEGFERWLAGDFDGGKEQPDDASRQWIDSLTGDFAHQAVGADHMGEVDLEKVRAWQESDRNPGRSGGDIPGQMGARDYLADYVATRDPASWEAFKERVTETDSQHTTRLRRWVAEQGDAKSIASVSDGFGKEMVQRSLDMQTSPIDMASSVLPVLRGTKALQAARAGGGVASMGRVVKGALSEGLQEGGTAYLDDARNSAGDVLEAAAVGAVGSGLLESGMAGVGAVMRQIQQPPTVDAAMPADEHVGDLTPEDVADMDGGEEIRATAPEPSPLPANKGRAKMAERVLASQDVDADVAALFGAQIDAELNADMDLEQFRGAVLAGFQQAGGVLPGSVPNAYLEQSAAYEAQGYSPEEAAGHAENSRVANEAAREAARQHNRDLMAEARRTAGTNTFAMTNDSHLSGELQPGNLPGDAAAATPADFTDAEAQARVGQLSRSLAAGGQLRSGQKLLPADAGKQTARTQAQHGFAKAFAGLFGRRIVVLDGLSENDFGAVTNSGIPDTVFLNVRSPRSLQGLAGHELLHHLENENPDLYARLDSLLQPEIVRMDQARRQYQAYRTDSSIRAEIYADLLGESMQDPAFWDRLAAREPGIFMPLARAVWGWFKDVMAALKARGWAASPYFKDMAKAQDVLAQAMVEFARRQHGMTPQQAQTAVREVLTQRDNFMEGGGTPNETRARFAAPRAEDRVIDGPRTDEQVAGEARQWLDSVDPGAAVDMFASRSVPLALDALEHAAGRLIERLSGLAAGGKTEVQRMWAHVQAQKMARVWTKEYLSADPARAMRQRAVVNNTILGPIAPVLAAQEVLADRAQTVLDKRFEGGTAGAAKKAAALAEESGEKAGESLADQLSTDQVLEEITATWQKIHDQLAMSRQGGGGVAGKVRGRLQAMRDAARQRRAAATAAENQFADQQAQEVEYSDEAIIGASLLADGTVDIRLWGEAMRAELGGTLAAADLSRWYAEASRLYHQELAQENLASSGGRAAAPQSKRALEDAEEAVKERAENRASQLIYRTEERLRQGSKDLRARGLGGDTINRAFREQITMPLPWERFAERLQALNVGPDVAGRLFQTAQREAVDQQAMRLYQQDRAREQRAERLASELIYRTEERLRQGSKDLGRSAAGDTINRAFRDQVAQPVAPEAFRARLAALNVPAEVAERLFRTAERETADRGKMREFKAERAARELAKNEPALARMLNDLRGKMYPGMKWADIFSQLPGAQKERQREIYRRLMLDERLRGLNQQERLQLTNELDKAWQRERRKVFTRELKKAKVMGEKAFSDRLRLEAAAPRLLRLMNLGMMSSELFREALAKEYGLKVIDAAKAAELRALGERIQEAPEGLPRRKLEVELTKRLQEMTDSTLLQIMESYWTAAVLSGWRTMTSIALSIANGIEDVGLASIMQAVRSKDPRVFTKAIGDMLRHVPEAALESWDHLITGNKTLMKNAQREANQVLEDGNRFTADVGEELWRKGGLRKVPGGFMIVVSRLMQGLDHIASTSTAQGMKAVALSRHPELFRKALLISEADREAARKQARMELVGGRERVSFQEGREIRARMRELLEDGIPTEILAEADEAGRLAALQGEPTGLGRAMVEMVGTVVGYPGRKAEAMQKRGELSRAQKAVVQALLFSSVTGRVVTGTKFVRTVAHQVNRSLSYVPLVGLVRMAEKNMNGVQRDLLLSKQLVGTVAALTILSYFRDDDDDEKGIEGGWQGRSAAEKSALMAQGKQPYSVWWRKRDGSIMSFSYQEWGIGGLLAVLGAMEDQRRYNGHDKADLNILINGIGQGMMSWSDRVQLQGLPQILLFGDSARNTDPGTGFANSINRWAAQTVGGLMPRIIKDIDAVASPELRDSSEWWMKWAQQIPMVREMSSGKRVDIFGKEIVLDRTPTSRVVQIGSADPAYRLLGRLNERDIWLTDPSAGERVVKLGDGTRRNMNLHEKDRYQRHTGEAYREYVLKYGEELLRMDGDDARKRLARDTGLLRASAFYKATH